MVMEGDGASRGHGRPQGSFVASRATRPLRKEGRNFQLHLLKEAVTG